ncbi:MAG: two-component sensor histidine kinase [Paracoccus denitrificans]|nr:MAG: two-component sensor histidine kinase [Paracoccus denitrificans]PZO85584.1 MAG: two-component sensor histidine kinase [Paracoccus denitrificans]
MRKPSLLRGLVAGFGAAIILVWLVALIAGWLILREELDEIYDASLARVADHVLTLNGDDAPGQRTSDLFVELIGPDGSIRFQSGRHGNTPALMPTTPGFSEAGNMRVLTVRSSNGSLLHVADPLAERREAALGTLGAMLLPSLLLVPLAFWGTWVFTRRRLAPIHTLSSEVEGRGAFDLKQINAPLTPVELEPLRDAINRLMARLERAFEAERSFSSNAAHELRTPIAAALAQSQVLLDETDHPLTRQRAETIARTMQRLSGLSSKLLELARAEVVQPDHQDFSDLAPILRMVAADFGAGHHYDIPEHPVPVRMDVDVFAPLARNLIENAERHGADPVTVRLTDRALTVTNGGPPVPPDRLAVLTRRFERAGSRKSGSGLGLAIAETLAQNAGGRLLLASPIPGESTGFQATVIFPSPSSGQESYPSIGSSISQL